MLDRVSVLETKEGPAGPEGPQGPQGIQGIQGIQGPAGSTNVQITRHTHYIDRSSVPEGEYVEVRKCCGTDGTAIAAMCRVTDTSTAVPRSQARVVGFNTGTCGASFTEGFCRFYVDEPITESTRFGIIVTCLK